MFIYFMQSTGGGPVKIGCAKDPLKRVEGFQDAHAYPLKILGVGTGGHIAEAGIHRRFAASRIDSNGWFHPTKDLLTLVDSLPTWEGILCGADCPDLNPESKPDQQTEIVCDLWLSGYSYADLARVINVTRQRVHQIVSLHIDTDWCERPEKPQEDVAAAYERLMREATGL